MIDSAPLPSPGAASSGELCPVLGAPFMKEKELEIVQWKATEMIRSLAHLSS